MTARKLSEEVKAAQIVAAATLVAAIPEPHLSRMLKCQGGLQDKGGNPDANHRVSRTAIAMKMLFLTVLNEIALGTSDGEHWPPDVDFGA